MPIPYGRQSIDDDDVTAVADVLRGDWLTQGPTVARFEEAFAEACGAPFAVAFSSGTAALHGAAFAAGVGPGDELATSAITFAASANCGLYLGAAPRFADIEPATWNVGVETITAVTGPATRLVVPVHFTGLPAPVREIRAALGPSIRIVEDASHAVGATNDGERIGSCLHSDMCVFSFHPVKTITTGEGGIVTTPDSALRDALVEFRTHGITKRPDRLTRHDGGWYQEQQALGFNYRLTDIQAALGLSQLRKLERFVERRNEVAARYRAALGDLEGLALPPEAPAGSRHGYHLFVVRCRDGAEARRRLYDGLREREIYAQVHYLPVYLNPYYRERFGFAPGLCPEAERYYEDCLSLPCYPALTDDDQGTVIAAVRELVGRG